MVVPDFLGEFVDQCLEHGLLTRSPHLTPSYSLFDRAVQNLPAHARVVTDQTSDYRAIGAENYGLWYSIRARPAVKEFIKLRRGEDGLIIHPKISHEFLDRLPVFRRVFQIHPD